MPLDPAEMHGLHRAAEEVVEKKSLDVAQQQVIELEGALIAQLSLRILLAKSLITACFRGQTLAAVDTKRDFNTLIPHGDTSPPYGLAESTSRTTTVPTAHSEIAALWYQIHAATIFTHKPTTESGDCTATTLRKRLTQASPLRRVVDLSPATVLREHPELLSWHAPGTILVLLSLDSMLNRFLETMRNRGLYTYPGDINSFLEVACLKPEIRANAFWCNLLVEGMKQGTLLCRIISLANRALAVIRDDITVSQYRKLPTSSAERRGTPLDLRHHLVKTVLKTQNMASDICNMLGAVGEYVHVHDAADEALLRMCTPRTHTPLA